MDPLIPLPPSPPDPKARPRKSGVSRSFPTLRAVMALILREMATRYGRSPGGYAWAILEPIGFIIAMSIGFGLLLTGPPLGNSFILFFATGFLPFQLYGDVVNVVGRSINFSRALLFYPAVTWVDALIARFLLNTVTSLLVMLLLFTAALSVTDTRTLLDLPTIAQAAALAAYLGLGIGVLNCALFGLFQIWMQVWGIVTRPLFLASGIFFLYGDMPPVARDILWYNPLIHVVGLARDGFYPTYTGDYISSTYVLAVSTTCLFFGVLLLGRYHRDILSDG